MAGMPAEEISLAQIIKPKSSIVTIRYIRQIDMQRDMFCQWLSRRRVAGLIFPIAVDSESWKDLCTEAFGHHKLYLRQALMRDIVGETDKGISLQTFEHLRACGKGAAAPAKSQTGQPCDRLQDVCQRMKGEIERSSAAQLASLKTAHDPNQKQAEADAQILATDTDHGGAGQPALPTKANKLKKRPTYFSMSDSSYQQLARELLTWYTEHGRPPRRSKHASQYEKTLAIKLKNLKSRTRIETLQMRDFNARLSWVIDQDLEKHDCEYNGKRKHKRKREAK